MTARGATEASDEIELRGLGGEVDLPGAGIEAAHRSEGPTPGAQAGAHRVAIGTEGADDADAGDGDGLTHRRWAPARARRAARSAPPRPGRRRPPRRCPRSAPGARADASGAPTSAPRRRGARRRRN